MWEEGGRVGGREEERVVRKGGGRECGWEMDRNRGGREGRNKGREERG